MQIASQNRPPPIEFCHIVPTKYIPDFVSTNKIHLVLAHLIEKDDDYVLYYRDLADKGAQLICDNSAFEMYKAHRPMFSPEKLVSLAKKVNATWAVMTDYPGRPSSVTINMAKEQIPEFKAVGLKTFFVPQSRVGNLDDYLNCFEWAIHNPDIDLIGVSILGAPNAFGVESGNKLQRFLSRWKILRLLSERPGVVNELMYKRLHFLGMTDGPNEIELVRPYHHWINSWDSSAAFWTGASGWRQFDQSPTGLIDGKYEAEVDFDLATDLSVKQVAYVRANMEFIDRVIRSEPIDHGAKQIAHDRAHVESIKRDVHG